MTDASTRALSAARATRRRSALLALVACSALAHAPLAPAQRYLSERVVKGVQVKAAVPTLMAGFVAQRTGPNEVTVRRANDPKSVEGKLECACTGAKPGGSCAVAVVKGEIVCDGAACTGGSCTVRAAAGWKLP